MAAMAVPVLVWLATEFRRRPLLGLVLAGIRAGPARRLHDLLPRRADRRCARVRHRDRRRRSREPGPRRARSSASLAALPADRRRDRWRRGSSTRPARRVGASRAAVCGAMLVGFAFAVVAGPPASIACGADAIPGSTAADVAASRRRRCSRSWCVVLVGPGRIAGDFAATSGREAAPTGGTGIRLSVIGLGPGAVLGARRWTPSHRPGRGIGTRQLRRPTGTSTAASRRRSRMPIPSPWSCSRSSGRSAFVAFFTFFGVAAAIPASAAPADPAAHRPGRALGVLATGLVGIAHRLDLGRPVGDWSRARRRGADLRAGARSRRRGDGSRRSVAQPVLRPAADSGSGARARSGRDRVRRSRRRRRPRPGRNDEPAAEQRRRARPRPARCGRRGRTIGGRDPALVVDPVAAARDDRARRRQRPRRPRASSDGRSSSRPTISASGCSRLRSRRASATTRSSALTRSERSPSRRWSCRGS